MVLVGCLPTTIKKGSSSRLYSVSKFRRREVPRVKEPQNLTHRTVRLECVFCVCVSHGWGLAPFAHRLTLTGNTTKEFSTCGWMHPYDCWTHTNTKHKHERKTKDGRRYAARRVVYLYAWGKRGGEGAKGGAHAIQNRQTRVMCMQAKLKLHIRYNQNP